MDDGRTISVSSASLIVCVLGLLVCSSASLPVSDIATVAQAPPSSETVSGETVKTGMKVLEKYVNAHLYRVPPLPSLDADQALYKAMYSLSVMQQYVHLIGALNFTSARLDSFAVVMEQVLSDSCEWSDDLKNARSPCLSALRSLFHSKCLPWLRTVTGMELTDTIDMTCSKYEFTDTLLCHDDKLEGRRVAFIYYLVPSCWSTEDGGLLELFDVDALGQPRDVVKSLVPAANSFVFFEVTPISFHQVSEVLSAEKTRLSVSGWFHGPPVPRPPPAAEEEEEGGEEEEAAPVMSTPHPLPLDSLAEWISPTYLDIGVQSQIQQQFEADSEIELPGFLLDEKYRLLCEDLKNCQFEEKGPPNKRCVHTASHSQHLPTLTGSFLRLVTSEPFCLLLSHMTGLELAKDVMHLTAEEITAIANTTSSSSSSSSHGLDDAAGSSSASAEVGARSNYRPLSRGNADSSSPPPPPSAWDVTAPHAAAASTAAAAALCRCGLFSWQPGDYTLMSDSDPAVGEMALDALLFFSCEDWSPDSGGIVSFIAKDEDEELLSVSPVANALSLVYRDQVTLRFTKYLNHRARCHGNYYSVEAVYGENTNVEH